MFDWGDLFLLLICIAEGGSGSTPYQRQVDAEARARAIMLAEYKKSWEARYR